MRLLPAQALPNSRRRDEQHTQKQDQSHHACLNQRLDIVVVDIPGGVVEGLDAGVAVLKGSHAKAHDWRALKELHAVLKEHHTLNGVLVGEQTLETVGHKAGQELIPQFDGTAPGIPLVGRGVEFRSLRGGEIEVEDQAVLRHRELSSLRVSPVKYRAGVHHGILAVLALDGHGQTAGRLHLKGIGPGVRIGGAPQPLPGLQGHPAGHVHCQRHIQRRQSQHRRNQSKHRAAMGGQALRQLLSNKAVRHNQQGGLRRRTDQGNRLDTVPRIKSGHIHRKYRRHR